MQQTSGESRCIITLAAIAAISASASSSSASICSRELLPASNPRSLSHCTPCKSFEEADEEGLLFSTLVLSILPPEPVGADEDVLAVVVLGVMVVCPGASTDVFILSSLPLALQTGLGDGLGDILSSLPLALSSLPLALQLGLGDAVRDGSEAFVQLNVELGCVELVTVGTRLVLIPLEDELVVLEEAGVSLEDEVLVLEEAGVSLCVCDVNLVLTVCLTDAVSCSGRADDGGHNGGDACGGGDGASSVPVAKRSPPDLLDEEEGSLCSLWSVDAVALADLL